MPYPIHTIVADKARPAVILTRESVRHVRGKITVAPVTSTVRGWFTEVMLDESNGVDHESVISLDNIATIPRENIGDLVGYTTPEQDRAIAAAMIYAFDLEAQVS